MSRIRITLNHLLTQLDRQRTRQGDVANVLILCGLPMEPEQRLSDLEQAYPLVTGHFNGIKFHILSHLYDKRGKPVFMDDLFHYLAAGQGNRRNTISRHLADIRHLLAELRIPLKITTIRETDVGSQLVLEVIEAPDITKAPEGAL